MAGKTFTSNEEIIAEKLDEVYAAKTRLRLIINPFLILKNDILFEKGSDSSDYPRTAKTYVSLVPFIIETFSRDSLHAQR